MKKSELKKEYGYTQLDGAVYILVQQAYINGCPGESVYYLANAIKESDTPDESGSVDLYQITWYANDDWLAGDREDEGDACDWDNADACQRVVGMDYTVEEG